MTHTKANKSKILALILGLTMCLALMLGIVFASLTFAVYAEGGTGMTGGLTIGGETSSSGDGYSYDGRHDAGRPWQGCHNSTIPLLQRAGAYRRVPPQVCGRA